MSFNCVCGTGSQGSSFTVKVQLLDNTVSEYSLPKTSTGEDCVKKVATDVDLKEVSYFGLKYGSNGVSERWIHLDKNLRKQIRKHCEKSKTDDDLLYFKIRFFATQVSLLTEDTTRYFYYLQLRENINDGILCCNEEEALLLASYALQAEYGDYDPSEHTEEFIQEYQLLPMALKTEKSNSQLYAEISGKHQKYMGMSTTDAEVAYIKHARHLECYGHELYSAKDNEGRPVEVGPCARGVFLKYDSETPISYFNWPDIVRMTHSKKEFSVETNTLKSVVEMESLDAAKYVWQMCVDHHQFYRLGDRSKKSSICSEQSSSPNQKRRSSAKRHSSVMATSNGFTEAGDGFVNVAFNDSTLEQNPETDVPESKRTSRESGIYGSSESKELPFQKTEFTGELYNGQTTSLPSTSHFAVHDDNDDTGIPSELLMASYKTFEKAKEKRPNHLHDPTARRSYPRSSPHSACSDRTGIPVARSVSMSVSMIAPSSPGENCVDSCSVQTMATSGYSTSTDSGLCGGKAQVSPMSPVSLLSSSSFIYEDYEVPSIDEQCKQLEAVVSEGRLDVEFARIPLKDEKKSTASGLLPINNTRNRFSDVLPYEDSRVHLNAANISDNDYINASFIKIKVSKKPYIYIATQAPLKTTITDFWQMIWEQNVKIIVMLYNKKDVSQECYRYWPKHKNSSHTSRREFDKFEVTTQFVNKSSCYKSSGLKLRHKAEDKERTIIHLQFIQWPDNGIPANPSAFFDFMAEVESIRHTFQLLESEEETSPLVVHCCAGVGRTGVFILADLMIAHLQNQTRQPFNVSKVLSKLRSQRMFLIRTVDQYRFVYILLIQYLKNSRLI